MVQSVKNNLKNKSKKHSWHLGFHWHLGFPFKTAAVGIPVWKSSFSFLWILERSLSKIQGDACNHVIQHYRSFCFGFLDNIQDQKHSNDRSCESAADEKATTTVLVVFTLTSESMLVMFQVVFPKISRKFGQSESVFLSLSLSRLPMLLRNCKTTASSPNQSLRNVGIRGTWNRWINELPIVDIVFKWKRVWMLL